MRPAHRSPDPRPAWRAPQPASVLFGVEPRPHRRRPRQRAVGGRGARARAGRRPCGLGRGRVIGGGRAPIAERPNRPSGWVTFARPPPSSRPTVVADAGRRSRGGHDEQARAGRACCRREIRDQGRRRGCSKPCSPPSATRLRATRRWPSRGSGSAPCSGTFGAGRYSRRTRHAGRTSPDRQIRSVRGQAMRSGYRRSVIRAKLGAVADLRAEGVDAMNAWDREVSCHRYARLRPSRIAVAADPLSARMPEDPASLDGWISTPPARPATTFVAGRRGQDLADSPHMRTLAQTNRRHRIPLARESLDTASRRIALTTALRVSARR